MLVLKLSGIQNNITVEFLRKDEENFSIIIYSLNLDE